MKRVKGVEGFGGRQHGLSEQEMFHAIEEFESAGNISIKEFAAAFQVSTATVYNWRKRYKTKCKAKEAGMGFVPVDLSVMGSEGSRGEIFAEFRGIVFYQRVDPAYLKALL